MLDRIALILVVVGAINWLFVGVFSFDLVAWLFGSGSFLSRVLYSLVGVAGVWSATLLFREHAMV